MESSHKDNTYIPFFKIPMPKVQHHQRMPSSVIIEEVKDTIDYVDTEDISDGAFDTAWKKSLPDSPHVATLIMVKNEEERILITLESTLSVSKTLVVLDTGSTDKTIPLIKQWCRDKGMKLLLKVYIQAKPRFDFALNRNVMLDFADQYNFIDYYVMLDCNDEIRDGKDLFEVIKVNPNVNCFHVKQHWYYGSGELVAYITRVTKARMGWRYKYERHEILMIDEKGTVPKVEIKEDKSNFTIYQDRTKGTESSVKRWESDYEYFMEQRVLTPEDDRIVYYLGQTCSCLGKSEEAYKYYSEHVKMPGSIMDEKYKGYMSMGDTADKLGYEESVVISHYQNAFLAYGMFEPKIDPLLKMYNYYDRKKKYSLCFMYITHACALPLPSNPKSISNMWDYEYTRHSYMGIMAWYSQKYKEGTLGSLRALLAFPGDQNKDSLKFYQTPDIIEKIRSSCSKREIDFFEAEVKELMEKIKEKHNLDLRPLTIIMA